MSHQCPSWVLQLGPALTGPGQGASSGGLANTVLAEAATTFPGVRQLLLPLYQGLQQSGNTPDETHLHPEAVCPVRGGRGCIYIAKGTVY